jgi:hypothetical protein
MEKAAPKECKEAVTKDTWKPVVGLEDGVEQVEEQVFLRKYVDYFAFSLHDLGILKGQEVRINLTDDAPIYRKPYKRSEVERKMIQARTAELLGVGLVELAPSNCEYASGRSCHPRRISMAIEPKRGCVEITERSTNSPSHIVMPCRLRKRILRQ